MPIQNPSLDPKIIEIDTGQGSPATGVIPAGWFAVAVLNNNAATPGVDAFVSTAAWVIRAPQMGRVPAGTSKTFTYSGRGGPELRWDDKGGGELIITVQY